MLDKYFVKEAWKEYSMEEQVNEYEKFLENNPENENMLKTYKEMLKKVEDNEQEDINQSIKKKEKQILNLKEKIDLEKSKTDLEKSKTQWRM